MTRTQTHFFTTNERCPGDLCYLIIVILCGHQSEVSSVDEVPLIGQLLEGVPNGAIRFAVVENLPPRDAHPLHERERVDGMRHVVVGGDVICV